MTRKYRSCCLLCKWISKLNVGPVFAGGNALVHVNIEHPDAEGFVAIIVKEE